MADDEQMRPPAERVYPALKDTSEYEVPLLHFFALHRYATPYDVMDALPQQFTAHNTTMRHLNWLHNKGYVTRHGTKDTGYVYNTTKVGYERCRDEDIAVDLDRIPYDYTEPKGAQSEHDLLITKCAVKLYRCVQENNGIRIRHQWRYMTKNVVVTDPDTGETLSPFEHLVPDYCYLSEDQYGRLIFRMLEVVRGVESIDNLRGLIGKHEEWGNSRAAQLFLIDLYRKYGAREPIPQYQTHCVFDTSTWRHTAAWKERTTLMQTFHATAEMQLRVWTTTKEELEKALAEGLGINHNIWLRGKNLLGYREQFAQAEAGTRTKFVDKIIPTLERHPLFA